MEKRLSPRRVGWDSTTGKPTTRSLTQSLTRPRQLTNYLISHDKSPSHMKGTVYLTNYRLIYLDSIQPERESVWFGLDQIQSTTYYARFLTSSPKINLTINSISTLTQPDQPSTNQLNRVCSVCGMGNPSNNPTCQLCGVSLQSSTQPSQQNSPCPSPAPAPATPNPVNDQVRLRPCPACTFLNHRDLNRCEMCDTRLVSAETSAESDLSSSSSSGLVKLSFRQSGDKAFYQQLTQRIKVLNRPSGDLVGSSGGGIDGLVREIAGSAKAREEDLTLALKDLNSLIKNANEMVISLSFELSTQAVAD
jgi:ESCRT-II complex subunit VPS36